MSIQGIRFRTEGSLVVLQVLEYTESTRSYYGSNDASSSWRDAKVEDMLTVARYTFDPGRLEPRIDALERRMIECEQLEVQQ